MNTTANHNSPVVVTGAAGFIGARLASRITLDGGQVIAVDETPHFEARAEIASLFQGASPHRIIGMNELPDWLDSPESGGISGIFHLGACTDTTEYDEKFLDKVNTAYTRRLWDVAARRKIPFLYASSAAVYGDGSNGYDDEKPPGEYKPLNPYGDSKHRFDIWALGENIKNRPPTWAGFRFFNVYGFGEAHKEKMSSVFYQAFVQILDRGEVSLFRSHKQGVADGHQSRDFIYVEDVVKVLLHAWRDGLPNNIYNLGTGHARTFLDLANAAFAAMGRAPKIKFIDTPPHIRSRYQYFTEAKMDKLNRSGYTAPFISLENGAKLYWERLKKALATQGN
jgi:ADP-L-glycero-D-manno-heptose 6-epimerase